MLPHLWKGLWLWSRIHGEAVIVLGQWAGFGLSLSWLQLLPKAQNHTGQCLLAWAVSSFGLFMARRAKSLQKENRKWESGCESPPSTCSSQSTCSSHKNFLFLLNTSHGFLWILSNCLSTEISRVSSWKPLLFFFFYFFFSMLHLIPPIGSKSTKRNRIHC